LVNNGKSLAIIPARGGSKRIPLKNIKHFCGKPIIEYSINAALESGIFDEVMVSTDHEGIAEVAKNAGAKVPFFRSAENSNDFAGTAEVLLEVLKSYENIASSFEYICCIYPTAPFVTSQKLKSGLQQLKTKKANAVVPVVAFSYPIQRSLKIEGDYAKMLWPENYTARSQDLMPVYHDCGQYYFLRTDSLLKNPILYPENTIPVITSELEMQDIDNETDWKLAEMKYQMMVSNDRLHLLSKCCPSLGVFW